MVLSTEGGIQKQIVWVVLPYHPLLEAEVGRALAEFNTSNFWINVYAVAYSAHTQPVLRIAWRNDAPNLALLVRKLQD